MTLIVAVICPEGIVLAADSKRTHQVQKPGPDGHLIVQDADFTALVDKIILTDNNVAIGVQGDANVKDQGINQYLDDFIQSNPKLDVHQFAKVFGNQLFQESEVGAMRIFIAGYATAKGVLAPHLYEIITEQRTIEDYSSKFPTARWIGETDIMDRLFTPYTAFKNDNGQSVGILNYVFPYQAYTLQSAVDYAVLGIETTIRVMALQNRKQTVGFPIDVLVMTSSGVQWLQKRELKA